MILRTSGWQIAVTNQRFHVFTPRASISSVVCRELLRAILRSRGLGRCYVGCCSGLSGMAEDTAVAVGAVAFPEEAANTIVVVITDPICTARPV